jgi:hypothetical protein
VGQGDSTTKSSRGTVGEVVGHHATGWPDVLHWATHSSVAGSALGHHGGESTVTPNLAPAHDDALLAEAFRDLHGSRLHGFAILVTLGETRSAERAAGDALAAGAQQAAALRHPERAAAWLRARTLRGLPRGTSRNASTEVAARREALANLGVDGAVFEGLAALGVKARAALIASAIECFEPIDIETILGAGPAGTRRTIAEARNRYLRVVGDLPAGQPGAAPGYAGGELATRVRGVAARTIPAGEAPQ